MIVPAAAVFVADAIARAMRYWRGRRYALAGASGGRAPAAGSALLELEVGRQNRPRRLLHFLVYIELIVTAPVSPYGRPFLLFGLLEAAYWHWATLFERHKVSPSPPRHGRTIKKQVVTSAVQTRRLRRGPFSNCIIC
jgi:hypothetical protein